MGLRLVDRAGKGSEYPTVMGEAGVDSGLRHYRRPKSGGCCTASKNTEEGLRNLAMLAVMIHCFVLAGAVPNLQSFGLRRRGERRWLRVHADTVTPHRVPVHDQAAEYLDAYMEVMGIADDLDGWLFRSAQGVGGRRQRLRTGRGMLEWPGGGPRQRASPQPSSAIRCAPPHWHCSWRTEARSSRRWRWRASKARHRLAHYLGREQPGGQAPCGIALSWPPASLRPHYNPLNHQWKV